MEFSVLSGPTDSKYREGYVKYGREGEREFCKVFKMEPKLGLLENQTILMERAHYAHGPSLLVPVIVAKDKNNSVLVAYSFQKSLQEWLNSSQSTKLFDQVNGIMQTFYRKCIVDLLNTIVCMHKNFIYHGDLGNIDSYVIREDNVICIVKPQHLCEARDQTLERSDFVAFKEMCEKLPRGFESKEWSLFLADYDSFLFDTSWILMHPVLYGASDRFHQLRIVLTRISSRWDNNKHMFCEMRKEFTMVNLYCHWKNYIPLNTKYRRQYDEREFKYISGNISFANYCEHVLKHVKSDSMSSIERDLHDMYPGLLSMLHSFFAKFSAKNPRAQLKYHCL